MYDALRYDISDTTLNTSDELSVKTGVQHGVYNVYIGHCQENGIIVCCVCPNNLLQIYLTVRSHSN